MANPDHLALARRGQEAIAQWRLTHPNGSLDLSEAYLSEAYLTGADLTGARLIFANLTGADLRGANLTRGKLAAADLRIANLTGANLRGAGLSDADLRIANLTEANLRGADLGMADLWRADLRGANLGLARLGGTVLGEVDLSQAIGLATVKHERPSSIGADTLIASLRGVGNVLTEDLAAFFQGAGVPQALLEALPGILAEVKYHACFVSYGQPDLAFAKKLSKDLEARGVSCWLYGMDATPGDRTWQEIGQERRGAEKMIVLCSAKALVRDGVLKEIEEQIDEDPNKIVPISLDDLWKEKGFRVMRGERDLKPFLLDKNYADFANLPYDQALERLLRGLSRRDAEISRR